MESAEVATSTEEPLPSVTPGKNFAGHAVEAEMARGGMGVVFRARRPWGRAVALKVPRRDNLDDEKLSRRLLRFDREVRLTRRLRGLPGVVRFADHGEERGLPWMTTEMVDGEAFEGAARSIDASCEVVEAAARVVHGINGRGVVHRDVKPANILVREDGSVVLIDLGLAHDLTGEEPVLDEAGSWLGTPAYGPPEQIRELAAAEPDARADVYSLSVVLYEAVAGEPPHGFDFQEVYRSLEKGARPLRAVRPDCPKAVEAVAMRGISRDPAGRFATALDLADALAEARGRAKPKELAWHRRRRGTRP